MPLNRTRIIKALQHASDLLAADGKRVDVFVVGSAAETIAGFAGGANDIDGCGRTDVDAYLVANKERAVNDVENPPFRKVAGEFAGRRKNEPPVEPVRFDNAVGNFFNRMVREHTDTYFRRSTLLEQPGKTPGVNLYLPTAEAMLAMRMRNPNEQKHFETIWRLSRYLNIGGRGGYDEYQDGMRQFWRQHEGVFNAALIPASFSASRAWKLNAPQSPILRRLSRLARPLAYRLRSRLHR